MVSWETLLHGYRRTHKPCYPSASLPPDRYQETEEGDVLTREELKHQSQLIVESKSKKKPWKNEKF